MKMSTVYIGSGNFVQGAHMSDDVGLLIGRVVTKITSKIFPTDQVVPDSHVSI